MQTTRGDGITSLQLLKQRETMPTVPYSRLAVVTLDDIMGNIDHYKWYHMHVVLVP